MHISFLGYFQFANIYSKNFTFSWTLFLKHIHKSITTEYFTFCACDFTIHRFDWENLIFVFDLAITILNFEEKFHNWNISHYFANYSQFTKIYIESFTFSSCNFTIYKNFIVTILQLCISHFSQLISQIMHHEIISYFT